MGSLAQAPTVAQIWSEYGDRLRRYLSARTANPADVDDVLQEVLLRTHQELGTVRDLGQLRGWLFRVAHNALVDHQRGAARRREAFGVSEALPAPTPDMPDHDQVELSDCVRLFLGRLDARDRDVLEPIDLGGRSQRDLAAELGVPYSTLKSRVQRARDRLAAEFSSCCTIEVSPDGTLLGSPRHSGCTKSDDRVY